MALSIDNRSNLTFNWSKLPAKYEVETEERKFIEEVARKAIPQQSSDPFSPHGDYVKVIKKNKPQKDHAKALFLTSKVAIVSLKMEDTNASDLDKRQMKIGYDILSGNFWHKKKIHSSSAGSVMRSIAYYKTHESFSESFPFQVGNKSFYWEKGEMSLKEWLVSSNIINNLSYNSLFSLQEAVKEIHSMKFKPSALIYSQSNHALILDREKPCFHGNITPDSIICEKNENGNICLKLSGYNGGDLSQLEWTSWWAPPEYVKFARQSGPYGDLSVEDFNVKFGQKKDAWSLALLLGTILQGLGKRLPKNKEQIPNFSFILNKLSKENGELDDSRVSELTQKEIDDEINEIKRKVSQKKFRPERIEGLLAIWTVINSWLTIDPETRPTVAEKYFSVEEQTR